jgi:uncharacterized protein (TIGR02687 family)
LGYTAMIISDKIQNQFDTNPSLRVLFFFDHEKAYLSEIETLQIPGVKIVRADKKHFSLKIRLEHELAGKKVLLYFTNPRPRTNEEKKKFILLDILIANKELLLDDVADFMDQFNLLPIQRPIVSRYIKDLKLKKHQKVLTRILNMHDFKEESVVKGLICSHLEFPVMVDPGLCLAKLFTLTLDENSDKLDQFLTKLTNEELQSTIQNWFLQYLALPKGTVSKEVIHSAVRILKYNALTQHLDEVMGADTYGLQKIRNQVTLQRMNALLVDWKNDPKLSKQLDQVLSETGREIHEKEIVSCYGYYGYSFFTQALKYMLLNHAIGLVETEPQKVHDLLQSIASETDTKELKLLITLLGASANLIEKLGGYKSYQLDAPKQYIDRYVDDFAMVDTFYREAILSSQTLQKLTLPENVQLNGLLDLIHSRYESHLIELNREWLACMEETGFQFKKIPVRKQHEFMPRFVSRGDQKTAVIISDALRYEVGQDLLKEILSDTKGHAQLDYVLSGLPSVTKWGMAQLLSDSPIEYADGKLSISGISTEGTDNREKILKLKDESAVAVGYKKLMGMTDRDEARNTYFNQKQIIYIYHDVIDAIGDKRKTELDTFEAVKKAINELSSLVKKVHSSYNISRVLITSDHGFLFNYRPLPESTFQTTPTGKHVEIHNRSLITSDTKNCADSYVLNLEDCANVKSELKVVIPKGVNRFKRQGAGSHFVHGGASLQEMIVPVIESTRKRKNIAKKVPFTLLNQEFKIVSGAIKLKVHQEEAVSAKMKPRQIIAGIYNNAGKLISNEATHLLDSTSDIPTERTKEFILNLSSGAGQEQVLTLKVFDLDDKDKLNPLELEKVINNTLIGSDF